jgi:DNA replication and repair protein RecF
VIVTQLNLTDFRNYADVGVSLEPGPNLIVGSNGQGKTNLVEALGYLSILGSHRVSTDQPMIRQGADAAIIRARISHEEREVLAEIQLNRSGANRAQLNKVAVRPRELQRVFSRVLFAPEDLALVRAEPSIRRRYLDDLLGQSSPRMGAVIADYERVLRQRNTLLKTARGAPRSTQLDTLGVWDEKLIALGSEIVVARSQLVDALTPDVAEAYSAIAGSEHNVELASFLSITGSDAESDQTADSRATSQSLDLHSPRDLDSVQEQFAAALARVRRTELDRGLTLVGPHRDDLGIQLNGLTARTHASHGESWSLALALKLASASVLRRESTVGDPVIILDDVFAELDESRRSRLASAVAGFEQLLITAAVRADVPAELASNVIGIRAGALVPHE